jgi:hypothetical protein
MPRLLLNFHGNMEWAHAAGAISFLSMPNRDCLIDLIAYDQLSSRKQESWMASSPAPIKWKL